MVPAVTYKIAVLGDPGVGKTALIRKFVNGTIWSNDNCRSEGAVTRGSRELQLLDDATN